MKKFLYLALVVLLSGCCSVKISKNGGRDMIEITNSSWRLFGLLAIASGDPECPNQDVCLWFCDSLLLDVNMMMLDEALQKHGYRAVDNLSSYKTKENTFIFLSRHCYHTSAELVK